MSKLFSSPALAAIIALSISAPALAAGEILITQAKALAGGVTPGDAPGFPVTLSLPGAYQFASNILPTANAAGIHAAQRNITIDLNGFELHGGNIANNGIVGVQQGTTVKNGTILGFKFEGINLFGDGTAVENMRIAGNGRNGVVCGNSCLIRGNILFDNASFAISCEDACIVQTNTVSNSFVGIDANVGLLLGNIIANNTGGIQGGRTGYRENVFYENDNNVAGTVLSIHHNACGSATTLGEC